MSSMGPLLRASALKGSSLEAWSRGQGPHADPWLSWGHCRGVGGLAWVTGRKDAALPLLSQPGSLMGLLSSLI